MRLVSRVNIKTEVKNPCMIFLFRLIIQTVGFSTLKYIRNTDVDVKLFETVFVLRTIYVVQIGDQQCLVFWTESLH